MATPSGLSKFITDLRNRTIVAILLAAAGATWAAVRLRLSAADVPVWAAVGFGVFLFACLLVTGSAILFLWDRAQRRRRATPSPAEIEKQMRDWAYAGGISTTAGPPRPLWDFGMEIVSVTGRHLTAHKPKTQPYVCYTGRVAVPPEIAKFPLPRQEMIAADVGIRLTQLGVEFEFRPPVGATFKEIEVRHLVLFNDSMHALTFYQDLALVERGVMLVQLMLSRIQAEVALIAAAKTKQSPTPGAPQSTPPSSPPSEAASDPQGG